MNLSFECILNMFNKEVLDVVGNIGSAMAGLVSTYIAYKVYNDSKKPKLILDYDVIEENKFDKGVVQEYIQCNPKEKYGVGFNLNHQWHNVYIIIKNESNYPIRDLKIKYQLELYKSKVSFGIDESDAKFEGFEIFSKFKKEIKIDYIPPQRVVKKLIFISYVIPKCKISIITAKSNERKFCKKKFLLLNYDIFEYVSIVDSSHLRRLLGVQKV